MLKLLAPVSLLLAGCQPDLPASADGLLYCSEGNPESFNPQLVTSGTTLDMTAAQLYDRLIDYDEDEHRFRPALAERWRASPDGLRYTFFLRSDVTFHETDYFVPSRNFNAQDVVFSFNRWLDTEHPFFAVSGGIYPFFSATGLNQLITRVEAIGPHQVEIELKEPDSSFLATLASDFAVILSAEYAQQELQAGTPELIDVRPIGTGPFKFGHFRRDVAVRLERHKDYWQGQAQTEQLVFRITPSDHKRMLMLLTRDCDVSPYPPARDIAWLEAREDITLQQATSPNTAFWAFNTEREPFDDPRVRQALAHAIDREALLRTVYFGHATMADSILPATSWAHTPMSDAFHYDPERARELLAEAGLPDGFTMSLWALPVQRAYNPNARVMAELMQSNLADVGVNATIVSYEWSTFRRHLAAGLHDSVLIGWSADHADPDNFFRPLLTCAAKESGSNRAQWCNPQFDELVQAAIRTTDTEERMAYYALAQTLLAEQVPLLPLAHSQRFQATLNHVQGIKPPAYGGIRLYPAYRLQQSPETKDAL
ncbi:MAG: ABC transporter substrate-binding protein [Idiomarina sp.]|nr:ABC transporter substrate-binding protein [Idiomarina sp.]